MKLRIKDDSVRFRVAPSEVKTLMRESQFTSRVHFSMQPSRSLVYSLILDDSLENSSVEFIDGELTVRLPKQEAVRWAATEAVALGATIELDGSSVLTLLVEKDFACLDLSDRDNVDTYANPSANRVC